MFRIGFEKSEAATARIAYYNKVAGAANLDIDWIEHSSLAETVDSAELDVLIKTGEKQVKLSGTGLPSTVQVTGKLSTLDAILLTGRENFHKLHNAGYQFLISENTEPRLVALFPENFLAGHSAAVLKLAADFSWQGNMISNFLRKALPKNQDPYQFELITGNESFDQRLTAVIEGRYDIGIFSLADLNAVSGNEESIFKSALASLKKMVLPLFECPPAFFQGRTGLAFNNTDNLLIAEISATREPTTTNRFLDELMLFSKHGIDEAGVFSAGLPAVQFTYLAGLRNGEFYEDWTMPLPDWQDKELFSTTEHMKDFFGYRFHNPEMVNSKPVSFLASHKVAHTAETVAYLQKQCVWAAGTRTWYEMAKKGIWVEGSADGIGLGMLSDSWKGSFLSIVKEDVEILTNTESAVQWQQQGWAALGVYDLVPEIPAGTINALAKAEVVFWTSFQQYQACKNHLQSGLIHATPAGKTAELLKDLQPFVFPSIKAFRFFLKGK